MLAPNVDRPDTLKFDGGCYTRFLPGGAQVRFDAQGRHIATVNRLGHTTSFHYNAAGRLDTLTVPPASAAARYVFSYDTTVTPARLKTVTAPPAGAVARVDTVTVSGGKVTAIRDPDSTTVSFAYDGTVTNRAVSRTDRRGTVTSFAFDAGGKVAGSTVDPGGLAITTTLRALESIRPSPTRCSTGRGATWAIRRSSGSTGSAHRAASATPSAGRHCSVALTQRGPRP